MTDLLYKKFSDNLNELNLASFSSFVVAFSGGVDSTALLLLCKKYADLNNKKLIAVTVNHNLRPESKSEAFSLGKICGSLKVEHIVVDWEEGASITNNIMERARNARYQLLADFCNSNDIKLVLTAHHLDDNIENFFIKLSRGSGIKGLVEHNSLQLNGILIARPLFNIKKTELIYYVQEHNIAWVEDPSNQTDKYFRNAIRTNLDEFLNNKFIDSDLFKKRIVATQRNLESVGEVFEHFCSEVFKKHVQISDFGSVIINKVSEIKFAAIWHELFCTFLPYVSGIKKLPRQESIEHILEAIKTENNFKKTLHGCNLCLKQDTMVIYREFGKAKPQAVPCVVGNIWDNRFKVIIEQEWAYVDLILPAEYQDFKEIDLDFPFAFHSSFHREIMLTLPVIRSNSSEQVFLGIGEYLCRC